MCSFVWMLSQFSNTWQCFWGSLEWQSPFADIVLYYKRMSSKKFPWSIVIQHTYLPVDLPPLTKHFHHIHYMLQNLASLPNLFLMSRHLTSGKHAVDVCFGAPQEKSFHTGAMCNTLFMLPPCLQSDIPVMTVLLSIVCPYTIQKDVWCGSQYVTHSLLVPSLHMNTFCTTEFSYPVADLKIK